jgi:uncharacterized protein (TIGR00369 family)
MIFQPKDPNYQIKVRESFSRQNFMDFIGAELCKLEPGFCELQLPHKTDLTQQHRYFHAGVIAALADTAGGYAAFSLMPENSSVLTVEYKINFMTPGDGERLFAEGSVLKSGKTLTICRIEAYVEKNGKRTICASGQMTVMALIGKQDF